MNSVKYCENITRSETMSHLPSNRNVGKKIGIYHESSNGMMSELQFIDIEIEIVMINDQQFDDSA